MRLRIRHTTRYTYSAPAASSFTQLRLTPRHDEVQNLLASRITVTPRARLSEHVDYYGTTVHSFNVLGPHYSLVIVSESDVISGVRPQPPPRGGEVDDMSRNTDPTGRDTNVEWLADSRFAGTNAAVLALAERVRKAVDLSGNPKSSRDLIEEACRAVNGYLVYAPGTTFVDTTVDEVVERRSGVCQDFAHLAVSVLRALGVPARYVSGYFYSHPDRASAPVRVESHAWIEALIPGFGWWEYDPTNGCPADERHVVVAVGRDYGDVMPVSGLLQGGGEQTMAVGVEIVPSTGRFARGPSLVPEGRAGGIRPGRPAASAVRRRAAEEAAQQQ